MNTTPDRPGQPADQASDYTITINGRPYNALDPNAHPPTSRSENPATEPSPLPADDDPTLDLTDIITTIQGTTYDNEQGASDLVTGALSEDEQPVSGVLGRWRVPARRLWLGVRWVWVRGGDAVWRAFAGCVRWPVLGAVWAAVFVGAWAAWGLQVVTGVGVVVALVAAAPDRATLRVRSVSVLRAVKYRKRRRRLRSRWATAMENAAMTATSSEGAGKPKRMPIIRTIAPHPAGLSVTVDPSPVGLGRQAFLDHGARIVDTVGALSMQVRTVEKRGRATQLDLRWEEPFPRTIRVGDLPQASRLGEVTFGLNEDGGPMSQNPRLPVLIVGGQGAGKSTLAWTLLYQLMKAGLPVRLRVFDPKGGTELGLLSKACWDYASDPTQWGAFIGRGLGGLKVRQGILAGRGERFAPWNDEFPLDLMLVDELVTVLAMSRGIIRPKGFGEISVKDAFAVYMSQQRSANSSTIALSQLGEKDVIGPARGLFSYVHCLRVAPTEKALVDILLGQGAHRLYPAHQLEPGGETAGIGWTTTRKEGVRRYRAAEPSDAERDEVLEWLARSTHNQRKRKDQADPEVEVMPTRTTGRPPAAGTSRRKKAAPKGTEPVVGGEG